jgi:hypothetical protein
MSRLREVQLLTHRQRKDAVQIFWLGAWMGIAFNWLFVPLFYGVGRDDDFT